MPTDDDTPDFYRAQAARCRRLAAEIERTRPDIAAELEVLAKQFESHAVSANGTEPKDG